MYADSQKHETQLQLNCHLLLNILWVFLKGLLKHVCRMSVTVPSMPLDIISWSRVEGTGVYQKVKSHATIHGFDLHISKLQFKIKKQ